MTALRLLVRRAPRCLTPLVPCSGIVTAHPTPRPPPDPDVVSSDPFTHQSRTIPQAPPPPQPSPPFRGVVQSVELHCSPSVNLVPSHRILISAILDLYNMLMTRAKMEIFADDAVMETPLGKAVGRKQVEAQWWAMERVMRDVRVLEHKIMRDDDTGFGMEMRVRYELKGTGMKVEVERTVRAELDVDGRVRRLVDRWASGEGQSGILEGLKRALATVTEKVMPSPTSGGE